MCSERNKPLQAMEVGLIKFRQCVNFTMIAASEVYLVYILYYQLNYLMHIDPFLLLGNHKLE